MKHMILAGVAGMAMLAMPTAAAAQQQTGEQGGGDTMQEETSRNDPRGATRTNDAAGQQGAQNSGTVTAQQRSAIDSLPADRRQSYDAMSAEMQSYYRGLTAEQQDAWWLLNEQQRGQVYGLQPAQRDAAWTSILQQVNAARSQQAGTGSMTGGTMTGSGTADSTGGTSETGMMDNSGAATSTTAPMGNAASSSTAASSTTAGGIRFVSSERVQAVPADTAPATGALPVCRAGQEDNCINQFEATGRGNRPLDTYPGERRSTTPRR